MSDTKIKLSTDRTKQQQLIEQLTAEALSKPYVHEECGDTLWDEALAANEARLKKEAASKNNIKEQDELP